MLPISIHTVTPACGSMSTQSGTRFFSVSSIEVAPKKLKSCSSSVATLSIFCYLSVSLLSATASRGFHSANSSFWSLLRATTGVWSTSCAKPYSACSVALSVRAFVWVRERTGIIISSAPFEHNHRWPYKGTTTMDVRFLLLLNSSICSRRKGACVDEREHENDAKEGEVACAAERVSRMIDEEEKDE